MKNIMLLLLAIAFLFSCSKEEKKLTLKNPEVFSFYVDDSWEVTATAFAEGFKVNKNGDNNYVNLFYQVDLITPEGDTVKQIDLGTIEEVQKDEEEEVKIESQIALGSNFKEGKYKLVIDVKDLLSNQETKTVKEINLTKEYVNKMDVSKIMKEASGIARQAGKIGRTAGKIAGRNVELFTGASKKTIKKLAKDAEKDLDELENQFADFQKSVKKAIKKIKKELKDI